MTEPQPQTDREPAISGDPWPALREFAAFAAIFVALWTIPYAHPAMEDYRYLDQLDFSPLVRAVTFTTPPSAAQLDMPGGAPPASDEDEDEALAKLDPTVVEPAKPTPQAPAQPDPKHVAGQDPHEKPLDKPHGQAPDKPAVNKKPVVPAALQITDATIGKPLAFLEHPERMDAFWQA
ncbi:MAG: hypothetical protein KC502_09685, partial [Myxococcales bacterium]|nr:hypothetical protein [Myxococcales bacterium]